MDYIPSNLDAIRRALRRTYCWWIDLGLPKSQMQAHKRLRATWRPAQTNQHIDPIGARANAPAKPPAARSSFRNSQRTRDRPCPVNAKEITTWLHDPRSKSKNPSPTKRFTKRPIRK